MKRCYKPHSLSNLSKIPGKLITLRVFFIRWLISFFFLYIASPSYGVEAVVYAPYSPVLITHTTTKKTEIYRRTLRGIYSMRMQTWPDGSSLTVFVLADKNTLHREFCKVVLRLSLQSLRRNWDRQIFSGASQAPMEVSNIEEMMQKVASTPGSIGYIPKEYVDDTIAIIQVNN